MQHSSGPKVEEVLENEEAVYDEAVEDWNAMAEGEAVAEEEAMYDDAVDDGNDMKNGEAMAAEAWQQCMGEHDAAIGAMAERDVMAEHDAAIEAEAMGGEEAMGGVRLLRRAMAGVNAVEEGAKVDLDDDRPTWETDPQTRAYFRKHYFPFSLGASGRPKLTDCC